MKLNVIYKSKNDLAGKMILGTELKTGIQFLLKQGEEFELEIGSLRDTYVLNNDRLYLQVNEEQLIRFFERVII